MAKTKEKKFEVRELTDDDLFNVLEITNDCSLEIKDLFMGLDIKSIKSIEENGAKIFFSLLRVVTGTNKDKIRGFLASLIGKTLEEYKKMPLGTTVELVMELKDNEDIKKFIATVINMVSTPESSTETGI